MIESVSSSHCPHYLTIGGQCHRCVLTTWFSRKAKVRRRQEAPPAAANAEAKAEDVAASTPWGAGTKQYPLSPASVSRCSANLRRSHADWCSLAGKPIGPLGNLQDSAMEQCCHKFGVGCCQTRFDNVQKDGIGACKRTLCAIARLCIDHSKDVPVLPLVVLRSAGAAGSEGPAQRAFLLTMSLLKPVPQEVFWELKAEDGSFLAPGGVLNIPCELDAVPSSASLTHHTFF